MSEPSRVWRKWIPGTLNSRQQPEARPGYHVSEEAVDSGGCELCQSHTVLAGAKVQNWPVSPVAPVDHSSYFTVFSLDFFCFFCSSYSSILRWK